MGDIFREIDEELRQERYQELWSKYGKYIIGGVVGIVVVLAAVMLWREQQQQDLLESSARYQAAAALAFDGKTEDAGSLFSSLAEDGSKGYPVLARLQQAGLRARAGDGAGAAELYDRIADDNAAPGPVRALARLNGAMVRLDLEDPDTVAISASVNDLAGNDSPWRFSAREVQALAALTAGEVKRARDIYTGLADDSDAPPSMRRRASELLPTLKN